MVLVADGEGILSISFTSFFSFIFVFVCFQSPRHCPYAIDRIILLRYFAREVSLQHLQNNLYISGRTLWSFFCAGRVEDLLLFLFALWVRLWWYAFEFIFAHCGQGEVVSSHFYNARTEVNQTITISLFVLQSPLHLSYGLDYDFMNIFRCGS